VLGKAELTRYVIGLGAPGVFPDPMSKADSSFAKFGAAGSGKDNDTVGAGRLAPFSTNLPSKPPVPTILGCNETAAGSPPCAEAIAGLSEACDFRYFSKVRKTGERVSTEPATGTKPQFPKRSLNESRGSESRPLKRSLNESRGSATGAGPHLPKRSSKEAGGFAIESHFPNRVPNESTGLGI